MPRTSVEVRTDIVEALCMDLVGPDNNHAFANELLPDPPQRWYLTGFLVPTGGGKTEAYLGLGAKCALHTPTAHPESAWPCYRADVRAGTRAG